MTIIVGGLLSLASQGLAPAQKKSIELDTKSSILSSVMDREELKKMKPNEVLEMYDKRIASLVVNINGEIVEKNEKGEPIVAEEISILKNYKKKPENRLYPVFKYMNAENPEKVDSYILPLYGSGLWDKIWGYVALNQELSTIVGVSYDHKQETPGLGARIGTPEIQNRYVGKEIYDEQGNLVSVTMVKGEGNAGLDSHHVDGMSGATLTGKGVNVMLKNYLNYYQSYFKKVKSGSVAAL
ncbi:NADH:ubiquinone reductase (Na(+)-transporting) subunit C [Fulvivirga ulvae]|uniref:NADH:ubiquinone reductase (Na(+)-transporting) subunit C n=1 Tax=Fulvivirga ulvae TaxID=2904245 RepID=UPI001F47BEB8|nr:NADH:ubiquinone reductase (Na(+)-transporting) subunit C [Fulvivirga ulvae]UII32677.1 NADH:ubiquinone reductase (Na(+)-transporting) subunit C [Fulvivirga ulvae]